MKWKVTSYEEEVKRLEKELAEERENNDAQAAAYVRRIQELNKQLAAERERSNAEYLELNRRYQPLVDALKAVRKFLVSFKGIDTDRHVRGIDAALAKIQDQTVQLPMINDDPVITLKD
jgi:deoxyadenosine/deoxycytidine kinase